MADSQVILDLLLLHIRGGCSLAVLLFFLMLVGTCYFILSAIPTNGLETDCIEAEPPKAKSFLVLAW